jgi:hypothetical protein
MIIASNGGSCTHPAWYYNLKAHPEVTVELGNERFLVVAEELDCEARSSVWPTIVEQSPAAGEFQRAITRSIPVFVLTREDWKFGGTVRYMLMICDDESDDRGPLELVGDTEHVAWIDYMDRHGISFLDA